MLEKLARVGLLPSDFRQPASAPEADAGPLLGEYVESYIAQADGLEAEHAATLAPDQKQPDQILRRPPTAADDYRRRCWRLRNGG